MGVIDQLGGYLILLFSSFLSYITCVPFFAHAYISVHILCMYPHVSCILDNTKIEGFMGVYSLLSDLW